MKKKNREILIGVTGGISAYKACELVRLLRKKGFNISVAMTEEATRFVTPLTFKTLSAREVAVDLFAPDLKWDPQHIALAERADLIAVVPATANFIAKLACGICDDIISCSITASRAKVVIAPAMNSNMYSHPSVRLNMEKIKSFGYKIIPPVKGMLACGKEGVGNLAPVETIAATLEKLLK